MVIPLSVTIKREARPPMLCRPCRARSLCRHFCRGERRVRSRATSQLWPRSQPPGRLIGIPDFGCATESVMTPVIVPGLAAKRISGVSEGVAPGVVALAAPVGGHAWACQFRCNALSDANRQVNRSSYAGKRRNEPADAASQGAIRHHLEAYYVTRRRYCDRSQ
jgi:hypothetical protein